MQSDSGPETPSVVARPGRTKRRWTIRLVLLLIAALAAGLIFLASPPGKALVLRSVASALRARLGVELRATRLDYRLLSRGVTLHGLALTRTGVTRPLLTAERVEIDFAPGIFRGRVALDRLAVTRPEIALDPALPAASVASGDSGPRAAAPPSFDIRRVEVHDLALTLGGAAGTRVTVRGLSLALVGDGPGRLRGEAVVSSGLSMQRPGINIHLDRARAEMSLAGASLTLASVTTESPVATIRAGGHIDISRGNLDVQYRARIDAGRLQQWWADAPAVSGAVELTGAVGGTLEHAVVTIAARGERLRWRALPDVMVSASGRWSDGALVLDACDVSSQAGGARVQGRGRLAAAGTARPSELRLEARANDARRLAVLIGAPVLPAVPLILDADLAWPGAVPGAATLGGRVALAALSSGSPGDPFATLEANGRGGTWAVRQHGALGGGTSLAADMSVAVDPAALSRSTIHGRVAAQSADVAAALDDLRRRGFLQADAGTMLRGGRARVEATLAGTLMAPRLQAGVTADSLALWGIDQVRVVAEVRTVGRSAEILRLTAEAPGNRVDVQGTATLGAGPIDLAGDGRFDRPDVLARSLPARWRPTGSLVVAGRLDGSSSDPYLSARISGSAIETNGIAIDTLDGRVAFERGVLRVSDLRVTRGDGWLQLDGDIDRSLERLTIRGRGEQLDVSVSRFKGADHPAAVPPPAAEALQLDDLAVEIDVAGTLRQPTGTISARAGDVTLAGRALGPVAASADGAGGIARFAAALPSHRAEVTGSIAFEPGWPFDARISLDKSDLPSLLALMGPTEKFSGSSGTVTASADVEGRLDRPFDSSGLLTLTEFTGQLRGKPLRLVRPGRIRFDTRRATVEAPIVMTAGGFSIGLAPGSGRDGVVATLEGRIEDGLGFLPPGVPAAAWLAEGPVRAQVSINRVGDHLAITGDSDATLDRVVRDGHELARGVRLRAQIRDGAIEISDVTGTVLDGPFTATGRVPLAWALPSGLAGATAPAGNPPTAATASARTQVALSRVLEALSMSREDVSGSATVSIEARASAPRLESVEATLNVEAGALAISKVNLSQQGPTRLRLVDGRLEVSELAWKGVRSSLTASGTIGLLPGVEGELRAEGTAALALLRTIAPGAAGDVAFELRVSGPPGSRRTFANVDLIDVSLIEPRRQLALAGVSGTLRLDRDVLEVRQVRGQLNGGELTVDGAVAVRTGVPAPRPLKVEGRGMFVEIPRGLRSQLDTTLTWENAAGTPRLFGQVSIASDKYREPITALAALAASLSNVAPGRERTLPPWLAATTLDVRVTSVGPLVVDQSVLKIEMVPDLQLSGTIGRPALNGEVAIQDDGRIQAGGRTYRITESRLEFSPATGLLPRLNVIGETRVSSYLVTLRITGPATEIETNFSSDPPLSERDVRSLLVTGQTADPSRGSTDSDRFAVGAVSGDVLGVAGQFVGLDSVRVGTEDLDLVSSDVNPSTRLTVSKRLGTKFELVLSENLEESQSTWIVIYRPVTGYEFRLSSEDNTTQAFEFRQEITFGPGVSSHSRTQEGSLVRDRIRSVTLTGDPGFAADQVLAATKVRKGDRFDFREWLDDRDRIVRFYGDRGYFTARVVPMRSAGESSGKERPVDLQYRITRGIRTQLEVTGYAADDELLERLRQTWSDNVLLDLLSDSLTQVARDHLIDAGFLRARIEVEVDRPEPATGRARVRLEPGPRTGVRRLAFSGNQVITSEALQDLAVSRGHAADAWKDPAPLIDEIRAAYAGKGYLNARGTAGPIEFSNDAATLPIRIEEGPASHVASIALTGVAAEREAGAREAVGLSAGSPYASGMGRAARARLERHYRDLGYRDVRVDVAVASAPRNSDVMLELAVTEGPLHVVDSVEISGVQTTKASLVARAIGLAPGKPAGAAEAAATERRLYDLGTFRRAELRFEPEPVRAPVAGILPVKAIVQVEEARRFQLRYGLEISSEYNSSLSQRTNSWGVAADIRDRNFLGRGMSLGGGLRYEPDLRSARALFSVPRLARLPIRTNLYLTGRGEEDISDQQVRISDDELEVSIEQRWRVGRAVEYSWGYSSNWRDTQLTSAAREELLAFSGTLASLNGAAVIDRRDSFFDAKRGWFGSVSMQWGRQGLGSDLDYLRTLVRGSYYQPVGPLVLAGNVRLGRLRPLGGVPPLTVFDLFFNAGGTESVRGYSQDQLSAYEFFDAPLGGTKLLVTNAEIRAPLFWRFGGVVFADAGNTFAENQPIRFRDLAVGLGIGLRINTPLAPVRIDLGFPRSIGESGFRWHFSIGQMF